MYCVGSSVGMPGMATENPPKAEEVQRALQEMRFPLQVRLGELQAQRDKLLRSDTQPDSAAEEVVTASAAHVRAHLRVLVKRILSKYGYSLSSGNRQVSRMA